ncbi:MAG: HU family DNA-binding protein [Flavobacterium sp.]|jgi:predicted histone-like DNA-binding protein|uniref:HU family DNA-binding protein n=1 Tax=Flavobacterium sp. TaxID=239 RepID=UPI0035B2AD73
MAIEFKMVPKQNNIVSPPQTKYYPCAVSKGEVDLEYIAEVISSRSTVTVGDCYAVLLGMSQVIGEELSKGNIVKVDRLGTFAITLKGQGTAEPELLNKSSILGAKMLFKPARNFKKVLGNLKFKRLR